MGGVVDSPTPTLIGEYGPEAVVPLDPTRPRVPEASMDTLDKILPTVGEATKTRGLYGSMSYEDLRRQKLREKTLGRAPLGVLG